MTVSCSGIDSCIISADQVDLGNICYHVGMSCYWCVMLLCRGQIVALLGDTLGAKLPECMPIFVDRLRNEITRLTAVRALSQIARYM